MSTPTLVGSNFTIGSTSLTGFQLAQPKIAALPDGQLIASWNTVLPQSYGNLDVKGQYVNANGTLAGAAFAVFQTGNIGVGDGVFNSAVVGLSDGGFAATSTRFSEYAGFSGHSISGAIFSGTTSTSANLLAFQQANYSGPDAGQSALTQLANGNIATVWYETDADGTLNGQDTIELQIESSSDDSAILTEVVASYADTTNDPDSAPLVGPQITDLAGGGFVVVWQDNLGDGSGTTVRFQRYDANANAIGTTTQVPADTTGDQTAPAVAGIRNGQFVVVYEDQSGAYAGDTSGKAIVARVFNADGSAFQDFLVDTTSSGDQSAPAITALSDGRFFIAWVDASNSADTVIRGQLFKLSGGTYVKDGSEVLISTGTTENQLAPTLTTMPDGTIVVAWQVAGSSGAIDAQIIDPREHGMTFNANVAAEQFYGTAFNDVFYAHGDTVVTGGGGFDTVIETQSGVTINIGAGTTLYQVQEVILNGGTNVANGSYSSDFIYLYGGPAGSTNTMTLGSGGGYEISTGGTNHMFGGSSPTATDVFIGGIGASDMHGGTGNNVYYSGASDTVSGAGTYNTDVLLAPGVTLTNGGNISDVQQVILNGGTNSVDMTGSTDFDILYGGAGTNTMTLGAGGGYEFATGGTNHMFGSSSGSGTDVFIGGIGTSDMHGGGGSNVYYVGVNDSVVGGGTYNTVIALAPDLQLTEANASDVQWYILNGGHNVIDASASSKPVIMTEQSDSASDTLTGGSGNDYLLAYGSSGQNILNGGPGDDVLIGYGQNDVIFQPGSGHDVVEASNAIFDLTAFAAVGIHSISDLTITDTQDSGGNHQLLVQMGSDSFSMFEGIPNAHLTAANFVFA